MAAVLSVVAAVLGAVPASAAADDLGPTVTYTGAAPTGYSVTFRYEAPAGVNTVQIYGEWLFSKASSIVSQTTADLRTGKDWQPGDVLAGYNNAWRNVEMTKGADGIWSYTTPLPSGTFSYSFTHDCTTINASGCTKLPDPENPTWSADIAGAGPQTQSQVYVPQSSKFPTYDNEYQAPTSAARTGTLLDRSYPSPLSTNPVGTHRVAIYLPAGYDPARATPYPTLYLSHGGGGNDTDWTTQGAAQYIYENAVKDRKAQPAVIVSTNFNGIPGGAQGYVNELKTNVIPFIEAQYNVSKRADDRAFGGLSVGGGYANALLFDNSEVFGYIGAWSAASGTTTPSAEQIARMKTIKGGIHIGVGLQDFLGNFNASSLARANAIRAGGLQPVEFNVPGIHSWDVWRQLLNNYLRTTAFRTTTVAVEPTAGASAGSATTLVAAVDAVTKTGGAPTGQVTFYAGGGAADGVRLGRADVGSDGRARLATTFKDAGDVKVVAVYSGDDLLNASTSAASTQPVAAPAVPPTTPSKVSPSVSFKLSSSSIKVGQNAKATVVVTAPGVPAPGGTFVIKKGSKVLKTVTLRASDLGRRTVTVPKLAKGKHTLTVVYSGSDTVAGKSSVARTLRVN